MLFFQLSFSSEASTPVMKFCQTSGRSDANWFDSAEGSLYSTVGGLSQFQVRMDRGTAFRLTFKVQKKNGR